MRYALPLALALLAAVAPLAQPAALPFTIEIVERDRPAFPALHSFAEAHHGGRWLLITGRTDGLHGFGEDPFPDAFATTQVWVLDPASGEAWSAPLDELPLAVREPLRVTNAQHVQVGETLYVLGGYGHSTPDGGKITFPTLTAVDVPGMMAAVVGGGPLAPHLRQTNDDRLRVTGGELRRIGDRMYLVGGHRFDGEYSGPGSSFFQAYTHAVVRFRIADGGGALALADYETVAHDPGQLRRRDLTVAPAVFADGRIGLGIYGGVFRPDIDWPFLRPIFLAEEPAARGEAPAVSLTVDPYEQKIGHYTAPAVAVYDDATGSLHTTLFGGMGLYYIGAQGQPVLDPLVPFIRDVVTVSRTASGTTSETVQDFTMPGLLGTNMAFFPDEAVPAFAHGAYRLGDFAGRTRVGHLYGGLEATSRNPGRQPTTGTSFASRRVFEVFLTPAGVSAATGPEARFEVEGPYPHPLAGRATVALVLDRPERVRVEVLDALGRRVALLHDGPLAADARHAFALDAAAWPAGPYFVRLAGETFTAVRPATRLR